MPKISKICEVCGDEYFVDRCDVEKRHTCGKKECKNKWQSKSTTGKRSSKILKYCEICGEEYFTIPSEFSKRHTCGKKECKRKWMSKLFSGENNPSFENKLIKRECKVCDNEFYCYESQNKKTCGKKEW